MELPAYIDPSLRSREGAFGQSGVPAFKLIDSQLLDVKKLINEQLSTSAPASAGVSLSPRRRGTGIVNQLLEYLSANSGKMIRPGLVLLAGSAVSEITNEHIRIAAIFEMIHNATLLHDDVIDDGKKRRGQPTINSLWGNEFAVLLGDFLLSRVLKMCTKLEPQVAREIAVTAAKVCEGELRQVSESRNWPGYGKLPASAERFAETSRLDEQLSEAEYIDIITEKSASIFSSCCYLGGLLSKGTETQLQSLRCFGLNAGIAFQITDDLLDIIGDERETGKTIGSDFDKSKLTLPLIHLLKTIDKREKTEIIEKLGAEPYTLNANLIEMLRSYGSLEYAQSRAKEFVANAIESLTGLKDSDAKDALLETAKFMVDRAK